MTREPAIHLDYWNLTREPFPSQVTLPGEAQFLYASQAWREASARIRYITEYQLGCGLLFSESGCGKTTLLKLMAEELKLYNVRPICCQLMKNGTSWTAVSMNQSIFQSETQMLFQAIAGDIASVTRLRASGQRYLLLCDTQQSTQPDSMNSQSRPLNSIPLSTEMIIARTMEESSIVSLIWSTSCDSIDPVWQQYAPLSIQLYPLSLKESRGYLEVRIQLCGQQLDQLFDNEAVELLADYAEGRFRVITQMAREALLMGAVRKEHRITARLIQEFIDQREVISLPTQESEEVLIHSLHQSG